MSLIIAAGCLLLAQHGLEGASHRGNVVSINSNLVLVLNGRPVFPIGFTTGPPPDGRTPEGKNGLRELADAGGLFIRTGPSGHEWDEATLVKERQWMRAAARQGMYCWPFLRELASPAQEDARREALLRRVVSEFKDHPALLAWKGADEPEWGKLPVEPLVRGYRILKALDPNHPLVTIHAPRGSVESLRPYNAASDVIGMDIYPVSYPPGTHSLLTNKTLSLVGEHTRMIMQVAGGKLPVWMVLQVSWSGVLKPGKTLRMPTFPEERFMTYQAIINGARGLVYFGGHNPGALSPEDAKLGWNWRFWKRVLRPVIEEIGLHSPLHPALVAPDAALPVKVGGAEDIEFCVRQNGRDLFILACKTGEGTAQVEFSGLPPEAGIGDVLYEPPRTVQAAEGRFRDWFAPFEVHVYRFKLP